MKKTLFAFAILFAACISCSAEEISILFQSVPNQPYFSSSNLMIDAGEYNTLVIKIKSQDRQAAGLFWATSYDPQLNQFKSIWFFLRPGTHKYYFNVPSQNPNWIGWIKGMALMPETGINKIEILETKAISGNFFTTIISGWQEFMSPRGRIIEGPTVNNMKSLLLWGTPINLFIYIILLVAALSSFAYYLYSSKSFSSAWKQCGQLTVFIALIFWGFLAASQLINEYYQTQADIKQFAFGSLEEKRTMTVQCFGNDFYAFLNFCKANLPERANIKFINTDPSGDYPRGRANYFLYPIHSVDKGYNYLVVYNYNQELDVVLRENPGFHLIKKFNERAYLCKK